ncbi:gamma-glutamyltransferase [Psychrosphaera ytuae]|uniref:Glutathione hydrolase proenzyme n=1 Tax=Psychrosphaera ytuae TaxID=2820710 RepID=A0A975HKD8_9GAMM|nr:gamma-glutamyltransferase [Psychrosphaera ytuae]QTH64214.1 gamma-glutamyltransferase [Psychrosphaera ytuae]
MRLLTLIPLLFASTAFADKASRAVPEAFTGLNYTKASFSEKAMVSAANPHAVNAAVSMLKKGGSAVDAAIAAQLMLTLVEPQSSGIGGGAFMLHYNADAKLLESYDGRETAPSKATPSLFLDSNGKPLRWIDAVVGGRSVGVPGILKMLEMAHKEHGKLEWKALFEPTIKLAQSGFVVSPRLAKLVQMEMNPGLRHSETASSYFFPNGEPIKAGSILKNLAYAETLQVLAEKGASAFYKGDIAKNIAQAVQSSNAAPGLLREVDLANYQAKKRVPVCVEYKSAESYEICSMGPPSSGGITVLQILKMLEGFDLNEFPYEHPNTIHKYTQAARLAFADRDKYMADSDFIDVPIQNLLDTNYLKERAKLISNSRDMGKASAGVFGSDLHENVSVEQPNTTHMSIVDPFGNAVSMTSSIEMGFGSTVMANGFLLNNQLTDFSLKPEVDGKLVANRVEANKRPRSSMTPVIIFKDDKVFAVIGSPGGSRIINYVGYALLGLLEYGLDMKQVIDAPRISNRNGYTSIEAGYNNDRLKAELERKGHKVRVMNMTSGIHGILRTDKGWQGAADPRREGTAVGL